MTALSDRLNELKNEGRNVDHWVEQAKKNKVPIDRATVYTALGGGHSKSPRESTIRGLAYVFGIEVTEIRQLLGLPAGELGPYKPTEVAARLNQDQRDAIDQLIKTIVREEGGEGHGDSGASPMNPGGGPDGDSDDDAPGNVTELSDRRPNVPDFKERVASKRPKKKPGRE